MRRRVSELRSVAGREAESRSFHRAGRAFQFSVKAEVDAVNSYFEQRLFALLSDFKASSRQVVRPQKTLWTSRRVAFLEQISDRPTPAVSDPPLRLVVWTIVRKMAALAKTAQIARGAVARIVVQMRRGKRHPGEAGPPQLGR